jgi:hypothetical protein
MKYEIKLLTPQGPKTEIYTDTQDLTEFNKQMIDKHGQFIMLSSNPI